MLTVPGTQIPVSLFERQNKCTMANSIENRVPYMDDNVVSFLFSLPLEYIVALENGQIETKYLLKKSAEKVFGREFAFRPKQGFGFYISNQMKNKRFKQYLSDVVISEMKKRGLINMKEFDRKLNDLSNYQNIISAWKAINIEIWLQLFIDGRRPISDGY